MNVVLNKTAVLLGPRCLLPNNSASVRAGLGVDTVVGDAQALDGPAGDEVLVDNLFSIAGLHMAVPNSFGIDDHVGAVLALVEAAGFVDADSRRAETGSLGGLLQLHQQLAVAVGSAGWARRARRTGVGTDEDVAFKERQKKSSRIQSKALEWACRMTRR
jgi:hypothetical protein